MMKLYQKIKTFLQLFGFNPTVFFTFFRGLPIFIHDLRVIKKQLKQSNDVDFKKIVLYPMMGCRYNTSGSMTGHYFHQDLLVARKIYENKPLKHIDIGSRVDGFISHLAVFREVEVFDVRAQTSNVKNIVFKQADLMELNPNLINYADSVSSLHAIEHFGLGRYGDPLDAHGHIKGLENIYKILKTGGKFYFAVPMGEQRIEFNGHRVFNVAYLVSLFKDKYNIDSFSYVDDSGDLNENVKLDKAQINKNYGCIYGCGIFELTKK